jgi:hypothetical protein
VTSTTEPLLTLLHIAVMPLVVLAFGAILARGSLRVLRHPDQPPSRRLRAVGHVGFWALLAIWFPIAQLLFTPNVQVWLLVAVCAFPLVLQVLAIPWELRERLEDDLIRQGSGLVPRHHLVPLRFVVAWWSLVYTVATAASIVLLPEHRAPTGQMVPDSTLFMPVAFACIAVGAGHSLWHRYRIQSEERRVAAADRESLARQ